MTQFLTRLIVVFLCLSIWGNSHAQTTPSSPTVSYRVSDALWLLEATAGALPLNVSDRLTPLLGAGSDQFINISPDGNWLVIETERSADCAGWSCVVVLPRDLTSAEVIRTTNGVVHTEGSAISSDGNLVINVEGITHSSDIVAYRRNGAMWDGPTNLTAASPYDYNSQPAISDDGSHVLFDCHDLPYAVAGTRICEVGTDGSGFRVVWSPDQLPAGYSANPTSDFVHHADYAPDGSILFEASWGGELIWRLPSGGQPVAVNESLTNDNAPCVLGDGRIVSLWLNRPNNDAGVHEIKVMNPDGSNVVPLLIDIDVNDIGTGCGGGSGTIPQPTNTPATQPTNTPTLQPTNTPATQPTNTPTLQPTNTPQPIVTQSPTVVPTIVPNAFYVATDGDDTAGNGSAESPWATITHALDSVTDGSLILVRAGSYNGRIRIRGQFVNGVTVRSEVAYQAKLRADETVLTIFEAQGITIEGFDISHATSAASPLVIHIQDVMGNEPGGAEFTSRITLRNNIIHNSYNNDLLKINNGAQQINILGNIFYNQGDSDEHIDINSVADVLVEGNVFFNAFGASNRPITGESSSFVVAKDSNGTDDGIVGTNNLTIRRNIFLHYEGSVGHNMVLLGEDGNPYFEVDGALIENNLFLGDGAQIRAPFGAKGVTNVIFRYNTISGDMPSGAFAMRLNRESENLPNSNISFYNNIWSDPTGTMGTFATAPAGESSAIQLIHNLYWNGGQPLPTSAEDIINIAQDGTAVEGDPLLPNPTNIVLPVWNEAENRFADQSATIADVFAKLVQSYAVPQAGSPIIDSADSSQPSPADDILGRARQLADLGAYESGGATLPTAIQTQITNAPSESPTPSAEPSGLSSVWIGVGLGGGLLILLGGAFLLGRRTKG